MFQIIPRPVHAALDYLWGAAHYFAPELLGYADNKAANSFSKFRGGSAAVASLFTDYELGVVRVLPYNAHLAADFVGAITGIAAPWIFGFDKNRQARNAVLGFAIAELGVVLMSKRD